jgi:hypothetical protein
MEYDRLRGQVESLREQFDDLQTDVQSCLRKLKNGEPPDLGLVQRLFSLQADFKGLRKDILALHPEIRDSSKLLRTLSDLKDTLDDIDPPYTELHREACTILDGVLHIVDAKKGAEPLENAHSEARTLQSSIQEHTSGAHPAAESLTEGDHPLAKLLALVTEEDRFSDEEWESTAEHVRETFPDLAVPLFRGRLQIDPERAVSDHPPQQRSADAVDSHEDQTSAPTSPDDETGEPSVQPDSENQTGGRETHSAESKTATAVEEAHSEGSEERDSDDTSAEAGTDDRSDAGVDPGRQDEVEEHAGAVTTAPEEPPAAGGQRESTEEQIDRSSEKPLSDEEELQDNKAGADGSIEHERSARSTTKPSTPTPETAEEAAEVLLETPDDLDAQQVLIKHLLQNDLEGLAYCLAESLEATASASVLPPWLLRAFVLGPHLRTRNGEHEAIAHRLQFSQDADPVLSNNGPVGYAGWLLAFGSALRPALHAPMTTSASTVLQDLSPKTGLEPVAAYVKHIHDFVQQHRPVDVSVFGDADQDSLLAHIRALREDIQDWNTHTGERTASYARSTQTWRAQLRSGPVARLREALTNQDPPLEKRIDIVKQNMRAVENPEYQKLYREVTEKPDPLEGKALSWLKSQFNEVHQLADRWLQLATERLKDERASDVSEEHTQELIDKLLTQHEAAVDALETFAEENKGTLPAAAAQRVVGIVNTMRDHLSGDEPFRQAEPNVDDLLRVDLLRVPDAPLHPAPSKETHTDRVRSLLQSFSDGDPGWKQAFDTYLERDSFDRSRQLLDALQRLDNWRGNGEQIDIRQIEEQQQEAVQRSRGRLRRRIESVHHRIEHAFQLGYIDYNDRANLLELKRQIKEAIGQNLDHGRLRDQLDEIAEVIRERKKDSVAEVQQRLKSNEVQQRLKSNEVQQALGEIKEENRARIQSALEEDDVYTAHAYIDRLLNNESLPEPTQKHTALDTFFPGRLRSIRQKYEHDADAFHELIQRLEHDRDPKRGEQLYFGDLSSAAKQETADVLKRWQRIRQQERATEEDLEVILGSLGFEVKDVDITPFNTSVTGAHIGRRWAAVEVVPPAKRDCPVPTFGSKTGGNYRFLLAQGSPTVEEIAAGVDLISVDGKASVALYFGMLGEEDRRELATLCHRREANFLVIDGSLFLFLLTRPRTRRLPALFECTLPFTHLQPYSEVGSRVPPEMFFGREQEIKKILDPNGPSLVYGGRQLGKTVLLRQAKREFHEPPHRIASWIDLRTQGVVPEETGKIWPILVEDLLNEGVFEEGTVYKNTSPQKIGQRIQEWLDADSHRRILLLLDEADSFFEHEQEVDFDETLPLKGLMEATNGRFKVVFAGLHNVLRVTDSPNQPLAHLSEPICVGPLLDDGEWQAARDLIERPLSALGYEFESDDLITFILSLTNYYPSLIQLYCRYLLEEMLDTSGLGTGHEGPPYLIEKTDIRESYGQTDLMRQIQERFLWTLQLDGRYEVLAYAIGYAIKDVSHPKDEDAGANGLPEQSDLEHGFSIEWIRQEALDWWPEGFRGSSSREHIEALLDEMVGLGVLRKPGENPSRYTLRSPNVLPLLGSREEMEQTLAKERVAKPEFDPKTHRRIYHSRKLAPLTSHQYGLLTQPRNGVNVIWGTRASGIEDIVPFLRDVCSKRTVRLIDSACDANEFEEALGEKKENRESDAVTLAIVDRSTPWGEEWVHRSVDQVNRLRSEHRHFRVVFLADAHRTWSMCDATLPMNQDGERAITTLQLQPWHDAALHTWFLEREQSLTARQMRDVGRVTGNWPMLLEEMEAAMDGDSSRWEAALDTVRRTINDPSEVGAYLDAFGLADDIRRSVLSVLAGLDRFAPPPGQGYRLSSGVEDADRSSEGCSTGEISEYVNVMNGAEIAGKTDAVLEWARRTGSASLVGSDRWRIDPLVGNLLQTADS